MMAGDTINIEVSHENWKKLMLRKEEPVVTCDDVVIELLEIAEEYE